MKQSRNILTTKMTKKTTNVVVDHYLDNLITDRLVLLNEERETAHKKSGKLSAGKLGDPLQWQILYALGVPGKELDPYVLRKFLRGNQVEDWLIEQLNPIAKQEFVEYRDVVGYIDALVDTSLWENNYGIIPFEVKSVTGLKFKRIEQEGPQRGHKLQAGLYALGKGTPHFAIAYVSADDLRVKVIIEETKNIKAEIDEIITLYEDTRKKGIIPAFAPIESWQGNLEYCRYPSYMALTEEEATKKYLEDKKII